MQLLLTLSQDLIGFQLNLGSYIKVPYKFVKYLETDKRLWYFHETTS